RDRGRGLVAALTERERGAVVAPAPCCFGQAPQRRRQPVQLGHLITLGGRLAQQRASGFPVTVPHRQETQDIPRGDPGGDAAAPVGERLLCGPGGRVPLTGGPLDVRQVR